MKNSDKIRVAVLYGGRSAEHEISVRSAINVIDKLDSSRFEAIPIGIDKQGQWYLGYDVFNKSIAHQSVTQLPHQQPAWFSPEWIASPIDKSRFQAVKSSDSPVPSFDVVFPAVHGTLCEDGTLQGLLETAGLPYVGCGVLSSAVNMDKDVAKRLAQQAGVKVGPYLVIRQDGWRDNQTYFQNQIENKLQYPVFVKPANTGSSIGITKVNHPTKLAAAIQEAFRYDTKILVEKALNVLELEIAVLESLQSAEEPLVSIVGEIKPTHDFYSYEAKYLDEKGAELLIPAAVSDEIKEKARAVAKKLFLTLECQGMARVDLFLNKDDQEIYFNEINTIPGFTPISMYPKLMEASGVSYTNLLTQLIELALKRHKTSSQLKRSMVD